MPEDDDPMFMAYRRSVWESDASERVPIHAGNNILILPSGSTLAVSGGEIVVYIDSRFAFGDGRHPTTVLCLALLEEYLAGLPESKKKRLVMLDIGTGTGILSILAARMGLDDILAIDIEPDSIDNAAELASLNGADLIKFRLMDAAFLPPDDRYGLITANLLPDVLRKVLPLAYKLALPGAAVIVSGIGDASRDEMEELMKDSGFSMTKRISSGWWHAYILHRGDDER